MKTEPYRNRVFFLKTEPKSTDLAKCETVTTLAGRPSLTEVGLSTTAVALALISITRCSQVNFDTGQEPTSRLHASQ